MNFFQGHISPVEYLSETSDKTNEIGDSKRALTWMAVTAVIFLAFSIVMGAIIGGAQEALRAGGFGLAMVLFYGLGFFLVSVFVAFITRLLGGDTTWGNYFCTSVSSWSLLIIPAIITFIMVVVFGPNSVMSSIFHLIYMVIAAIYSVATISASGLISVPRAIMVWIITVVLFSLIAFGVILLFGAVIIGFLASSGMLPY